VYNILCVDDTEANLFILESLFEQYNDNYNVITALSGEKALGVLLENKVDLILLDVMMPVLSGFETARLIKANKLTKDIPIIFLTAKRDDETIHDSFKYGVDYLSKPYDEFELFTRIDTHLKLVESKQELKKQVEFNQAVLDSQRNIIFIQDKNEIVKANKSFLDFFNVKSIEQFNNMYSCITELFMEYENYFALNILNNHKLWYEDIIHTDKVTEYNIMIMDTKIFEPKSFKIDVSEIKGSQKFVITFTDITSLTTKSKRFETKATYDELTSIYNRSKFNEVMIEYFNLFTRYNEPLCFAIFDIDFFKQVNDTYGHLVGDEVLIKFSQTINSMVRATDVFARWGGEEFTLLMPGTKIDDGFEVVNKIREVIENVKFEVIGQKTCSVGVTQFKKDDTIDSALVRADEALYEAKESGRNKVCVK